MVDPLAPRNNFKAVIAEDVFIGLEMCRLDLQQTLVPPWLAWDYGVEPGMFQFQVSEQPVESGRFWMPSSIVWCHWHNVEEKGE